VQVLSPGWSRLGQVAERDTDRVAKILMQRIGSDYLGRFPGPNSIPLGVWAPTWVVACRAVAYRSALPPYMQNSSFRRCLQGAALRPDIQEGLSTLYRFGADIPAILALLASFGVAA